MTDSEQEFSTIVDFVREVELPFHGVRIVANGFKDNGDPKKTVDKTTLPGGWQKTAFTRLVDEYLTGGGYKHGWISVSLNKSAYLVIDADSKESKVIVTKHLKKNGIYHKGTITKSFTNMNYEGFEYKLHHWFKVNPDDYTDITKRIYGEGWDLLYAGCFCFENTETSFEAGEMPVLERSVFDEIRAALPNENVTKEELKKIEDKKKAEKKQVEEDGEVAEPVVPKKKTTPIATVEREESTIITDDNLRQLLDGINIDRINNYGGWLTFTMVFINDGLNMEIHKEYSMKAKGYDEASNATLIAGLKRNSSGYHIATLYKWLKEDNYELFKVMQRKRSDNWRMLMNISDIDIARLFYNMCPDSYMFSVNSGWYAYDANNIIISYGKHEPHTLMSDISDKIRLYLSEMHDSLSPSDKDYKLKADAIAKLHQKIGDTQKCTNVIKQLKNIYTILNIDDKFDTNPNVICFKNMLYDYELGDFRAIEKSDFITLTTKYNIDRKSNKKIRKEINDIINSIFPDEVSTNYWKATTCKSMFGEKMELFFIHTGRGGNGKGVLSGLLQKAMGMYYVTAENTFLTTKIESGKSCPTLVQAKGARFLSISEPDNGSEGCTLNIDFIKSLSGGDVISCRDLYKSNIQYIPQFTCHMQCNTKPDLAKIDRGIVRRLKIIPYPFQFVDEEELGRPNYKLKNHALKDILEKQAYVNEFMLMLFEYAQSIKGTKINEIEQPESVTFAVNDYIEDNNPVKSWIDTAITFTDSPKDGIKTVELLAKFNATQAKPMTAKRFKAALDFNNITIIKRNGCMTAINVQFKADCSAFETE